jgi:hypothetical protein
MQISGLPGLKIYVLGPPRDKAKIGLEEKAGEHYGQGAALGAAGMLMQAAGATGSIEDDWGSPFDAEYGVALAEILPRASQGKAFSHNVGKARRGTANDHAALETLLRDLYVDVPQAEPGTAPAKSARAASKAVTSAPDQSWRRIDGDWLGAAADLALQLDRGVNNTSLVLAFEFVETGRVALFVGDAQAGNWLSWQDVVFEEDANPVKGPDLLRRTVYLKVGHHGSHNATLKAKGLELMTSPDLSAFIPVNEVHAKRIGWKDMPLTDLVNALQAATRDRVIRADDAWIGSGIVPPHLSAPSGSLRAVRCKPGLYVEFDLG